MATPNPTTPRARYEALIEQCENLSFDQAVERFNYLGYSVTKRFPDGGYDTFIDEVWTKKGLKQFLALLEFHNAYLISDDDEVSSETAAGGESAHDRVFYRLNSIIAVSDLLAESGEHGTFREGSLHQIGVLLHRTAEELYSDVTEALEAGRAEGAS